MLYEKTADIRRVLTNRCAALGIPVSGIFELTPRCNLRCRMCYIRLSSDEMKAAGRELTAEEWSALGKAAVAEGMTFLLITGGEPTLRSDFCDIYEDLMNMGLSICINTNGTLIDERIKELWHRLPPAYVNVTLYGTSCEEYEISCGDGSAFIRVCEALDWLKEEGILVHLNTTISPANKDNWEKIENFAVEYGAELRMTAYCFPPVRRENGNRANICFSRLTPEEAGKMIVQDIYFREGKEGVLKRAADIDKPVVRECELETGETVNCMAGRAQFWVNWNGSMTPCGMLKYPVVYPLEEGFSLSWQKLRKQTETITLCSECAGCEIRTSCTNCAAASFAETGSFDGKPEYLCKMNIAYRAELLSVSEKLSETPDS